MAITTLAVLGDSIAHGESGDLISATYQGGQGTWFEIAMEELANALGVQRLSSGARVAVVEDTLTVSYTSGANAWTDVVSSNAWDKLPYGQGRYATGINKVVTFNINQGTLTRIIRPVVGFALYLVDLAGGGAPQYRVDGGTWTNSGMTVNQNNTIKKLYISTPVGQKVEVRCYNGSSDVTAMPGAIEWFYTNPTGMTTGLIGHNYAAGGTNLHDTAPASTGDHLAILDAVVLDAGSPPTSTPNGGVLVMQGHDAITYPTLYATQWATDLTTVYNRASPLGPVGFINDYEFDTALATSTVQANYRAQTKTTGASLGAKVFDLFDAYNALGWGGAGSQNTNLKANGYLASVDSTHESRFGHIDIAARIYWWLRVNFFSLGNTPSTYTATSKQASVQYKGKQATVQYLAGSPIGVG